MATQESSGISISEFDDQTPFLRPARGEILRVGLLGALVGVLTPAIAFLADRFFIQPVFCASGDALGICGGNSTAYYAASVVFAIVATVVLANWQVFRPLLIAVGATAALWGFSRYVQTLMATSGLEYYVTSAVLYGAAYLLFYWIMRIRVFAISVVLAAVLVFVARLVLLA
jgi:hypothetical protein